jgi:hypothetical protein
MASVFVEFGVLPFGAAPPSNIAHVASITETLAISQTSDSVRGIHDSQNEHLTLTPAPDVIKATQSSLTETIALSHTNATRNDWVGGRAETLNLSDTETVLRNTPRGINEAIALTGTATATMLAHVTRAETLALTAITTIDSVYSNNLNLSDSAVVQALFHEARADTINLSATHQVAAQYHATVSEALGLSYSMVTGNLSYADINETLFLAGNPDAIAAYNFTLNEMLGLYSKPDYAKHDFESFTENTYLSDSYDCVHFPMRSYYLRQSVISQYANSPTILSILDSWSESIDQAINIDNFSRLIWDVSTAEGYGLDVWGRIVNISRTLQLSQQLTGPRFGFTVNAGVQTWKEFNQAPFFSGFDQTSSVNYVLPDFEYRRLIMAKAYANISRATTQDYNYLLRYLFPNRGNCYVVDHLDMTISLVFDFILDPFEVAMLQQSGVFKLPTGVGFNVAVTALKKLKFYEAGLPLQNFNSTTTPNPDAGYFNQ